MCNWVKSGNQRIDPCLRKDIAFLQGFGFKTLACCCGHGKYSRTLVYENGLGERFAAIIPKNLPVYLLQGMIKMPRKKRFYKRDSNGVFFIPEFEQLNSQQTKGEK
jgi:hypothetical protein